MDKTPTITQIESGIEKVFLNSEQLLRSAGLLQSNKDFPRAYALTHLATEEMAKVFILNHLAMLVIRGKSFKVKTFRRDFSNHLVKTANSMVFDDIMTGDPDDSEADKKWRELISNPRLFVTLKNQGLYVVWDDKGNFHNPLDTIKPELVEPFIAIAEKRLLALRDQQKIIWGGILSLKQDRTWKKNFFKDLAIFQKNLRERLQTANKTNRDDKLNK